MRLAAGYLRSFPAPSDELERLVDKAPGNFHYLGLIALLLPNARIVHVRRDPLDTCISNWTTCFGPHRCVYANDLEDLAAYHEDYQRLMAHWRAALPLAMHELDYEAFVTDPAARTRDLLRFLELPWDPACLAFHRSRRDVPTASALQVRRPVHGRSVGRWRRYRGHLGPLLRLSRARRR